MVNNPEVRVYEEMVQILIGKGYGYTDDLFSDSEVALLREMVLALYQEDELRLPGIGNRFNKKIVRSVRNDRIHWLNRHSLVPIEKEFFNRLQGFIDYLNRTCFAGIRSHEFHYAAYPPGSFYKRHADQFNNDDRRVISFVMYLHEKWEEGDGGELAIYMNDETNIVKPLPGRVVIFNSEIEHEVLVSNKLRLSLTGWLRRSDY